MPKRGSTFGGHKFIIGKYTKTRSVEKIEKYEQTMLKVPFHESFIEVGECKGNYRYQFLRRKVKCGIYLHYVVSECGQFQPEVDLRKIVDIEMYAYYNRIRSKICTRIENSV